MVLCPLGRGEQAAILRHLTAALPSTPRMLTGGILGAIRRSRLVQLGGDACNRRQLGRIGRYGRAGRIAGIVVEARRGEVLGGLRRRGQRRCGGTGARDGLGRGETRGIALRMAGPELGEH